MDYCDIVVCWGYGQMDPVWSLLFMLRPWMGHEYIIIWVICWVELPEQRRLCPIFCENMDPNKWDITVWYPQEFRGLTGCQRTPGFWGVTVSFDCHEKLLQVASFGHTYILYL